MSVLEAIEDGEVIEKAGAYRMSMDWYHAQCCAGPSISSSGLRTIFTESPWHFWAKSDLNPDRYTEDEESDALILGRAAHALILGEEDFDAKFLYVPADAPRRPSPQQIKAYDEGRASEVGAESVEFWRAFDEKAEGRKLLTETQVRHIKHMAENLAKSPEAQEALGDGLAEVSLIWQDPITGVWLKSRPDMIPANGADYADLKTFSPRSKNPKVAVQRAVTEHAYTMQMALGAMGAEAVFQATAAECVLVFVQSTPPYTVIPVRLDEDAMYYGRVMCRSAIDTFARCLESGEWPGPVEGIMDYSIPPSLLHRLGEMQAEGDLPMEA